jgi:hypothetical protein
MGGRPRCRWKSFNYRFGFPGTADSDGVFAASVIPDSLVTIGIFVTTGRREFARLVDSCEAQTGDILNGGTFLSGSDNMSPRALMWSGIALCVLAIVLGFVQINMGMLFVPWYQPAISAVGVLLLLIAFSRKRSVGGGIALVVFLAMTGFQVFALGVMMKTPPYTGPVKAGSPMPTFTTAYADGRPFSDKDLAEGKTTVMTFFRGRW